jgi:hypothetical protein
MSTYRYNQFERPYRFRLKGRALRWGLSPSLYNWTNSATTYNSGPTYGAPEWIEMYHFRLASAVTSTIPNVIRQLSAAATIIWNGGASFSIDSNVPMTFNHATGNYKYPFGSASYYPANHIAASRIDWAQFLKVYHTQGTTGKWYTVDFSSSPRTAHPDVAVFWRNQQAFVSRGSTGLQREVAYLRGATSVFKATGSSTHASLTPWTASQYLTNGGNIAYGVVASGWACWTRIQMPSALSGPRLRRSDYYSGVTDGGNPYYHRSNAAAIAASYSFSDGITVELRSE